MKQMSQQLQQHVADGAAALSTVTVAAYSLTEFLEHTALIIAIISGSFAIAWHVYQFVRAHKERKEGKKE